MNPEANLESTILRLKMILISKLHVSKTTVEQSDPDQPLVGRGIGLDSMETLTLIAGIEEEFGISVPDEDLRISLFKDLRTLGTYIMGKLAATE